MHPKQRREKEGIENPKQAEGRKSKGKKKEKVSVQQETQRPPQKKTPKTMTSKEEKPEEVRNIYVSHRLHPGT